MYMGICICPHPGASARVSCMIFVYMYVVYWTWYVVYCRLQTACSILYVNMSMYMQYMYVCV